MDGQEDSLVELDDCVFCVFSTFLPLSVSLPLSVCFFSLSFSWYVRDMDGEIEIRLDFFFERILFRVFST